MTGLVDLRVRDRDRRRLPTNQALTPAPQEDARVAPLKLGRVPDH
jgi:hypothetical protein